MHKSSTSSTSPYSLHTLYEQAKFYVAPKILSLVEDNLRWQDIQWFEYPHLLGMENAFSWGRSLRQPDEMYDPISRKLKANRLLLNRLLSRQKSGLKHSNLHKDTKDYRKITTYTHIHVVRVRVLKGTIETGANNKNLNNYSIHSRQQQQHQQRFIYYQNAN